MRPLVIDNFAGGGGASVYWKAVAVYAGHAARALS